MASSNQKKRAKPDGIVEINAIIAPSFRFHSSERQHMANSKHQNTVAAAADHDDNTEPLQIFMEALFTGLRDDPASIAAVDRITREIEAAEALARAAAGSCPSCGALEQHQRKEL